MPRQPDPDLEQHILQAASRLWARGGEKSLTMRAVAKAARTTTPTVYERFRDREDILRALRLKTREQLFDKLSPTRTLAQACQVYLEFALQHREAYGVLFDATHAFAVGTDARHRHACKSGGRGGRAAHADVSRLYRRLRSHYCGCGAIQGRNALGPKVAGKFDSWRS